MHLKMPFAQWRPFCLGLHDNMKTENISMKHHKYPCFCILPLEFGVNIYIRKYENSEVLCWNPYKFPKETSGNSRLQIHGNMSIDITWLNIQAKYLIQQCYATWSEIMLYESDPNAPSTCSETGGKQWQHSIRGWRNQIMVHKHIISPHCKQIRYVEFICLVFLEACIIIAFYATIAYDSAIN